MRVVSNMNIGSDSLNQNGDVAIIVLFGPTGAGKTTFANVASGSTLRVGNGLKACTQEVAQSEPFIVDDRPVVVIDCPGFDDTYLSETEILTRLGGFLAAAYSNMYKITGLLYMHRIIDPRVGGTSLRHMNMFKELCGTESLQNVVYVTNMWSDPPTENEMLREIELRDDFFDAPLSQGAQMTRHWNTRESALDIIRLVLKRNPTVPKLARQLVDEGLSLEDTDAGKKLGGDLEKAIRGLQEEIQAIRAEHDKANSANNDRWKRQLERQEQEANEKHQRLLEEINTLKRGHSEEERKWDERVMKNQIAMFERMQQLQLEHDGKIERLMQSHNSAMERSAERERERSDRLEAAHRRELAEAHNRNEGGCVIA